MTDSVEKWDRIYREAQLDPSLAVPVLSENTFLLPPSGTALDLACGLGANAVFLAIRGFDVLAIDQSAVAVDRLKEYASLHHLPITTRRQSVDPSQFPKSGFDVIIVSRFLDRNLSPAIMQSLKSGGLLYYQTYTREKTGESGPRNPDYLLAENELLRLFAPLKVVYYRENGLTGDIRQGLRNEAQFIGRKIHG